MPATQTSGPTSPAPPGGVTAPFLATPLRAYLLTVEADPKLGHRLASGATAAILAVVWALLAWHDIDARHPGGLLEIGLGRLAGMISRQSWPLSWLVSALEALHYASLCAFMAVTVWFGAIRRPAPLPRELVVFHRRQSPWVAANAGALGAAGLLGGHLLDAWGVGLLAVPLEFAAVSMLCLAAWLALVPEARTAVSVILDANAGWGNRIVLSGGIFRRSSRVTITKDQLLHAEARDVGGLELAARARTLELCFQRGAADETVRISGIAPDPEIAVLASLLNSRFKLGLTPEGLIQATRLGRQPLEAQAVINTQI